MDYKVVPKIRISKERCSKVGEFLYDKEIDGLYYEGPYPFPVQLLVSQGLSNVEVTPGFLRLPFILRGWINFDILLREIDLMKMALQGKLLLHASCVDDTLIVGLPNSGKTYQTFKSTAMGGILVSEEYTVISKAPDKLKYEAYPYRRIARSCLSHKTIKDCGFTLNGRERMELALRTIRAKLMPFMFEAVIWKEFKTSPRRFVVNKIVYGSTGVEVKNYKHLIILTENEFPFMGEAFLEAYALISGLDIIEIQNKQRQLIKEFVDAVYPAEETSKKTG